MRVLGIDLGTTNTVAALDDRTLPLSPRDGRGSSLPSVVAFLPNGVTRIGLAAKRRRWIDSENTVFSAKRIIGRRFDDAVTQAYRERYPLQVVEGEGGVPAFETRAGRLTAVDIAAEMLTAIRDKVTVQPLDFDRAAVTVPAGFGMAQREATLAAAEQAGLVGARLVDEALATAHAYGRATNPVSRAGVYDLGGGTFDFSIVEWKGGEPELVESQSDLALGGDDIDQVLAEWAADQVLKEWNWDLRNYSEIYARLVAECEQAKIRLSFFEETVVDLSQVDTEGSVPAEGLPISREILDRISEDLVRRTFVTCDGVLAAAGLRPGDLDAVFLAGGSTHLGKVRDGVEAYFAQPGRFELEPTEVVALGASWAR